jgi:signal transduction histidine kinase
MTTPRLAHHFACAVRRVALTGGFTALATFAQGAQASGTALSNTLAELPVLLLVAALAGALGAWVAHTRQRAQLRAAREGQRRARQLSGAWHWQTDAEHRMEHWSHAQQVSTGHGAPFNPTSHPAWLARLQQQQAFSDLLLSVPVAVQASRQWRLAGLPTHADDGSFVGFEGRAWPMDEQSLQAQAAAALPAALAACGEPALLALESIQGWQLAELNPAAALLWPKAHVGQPVGDLLTAWPELPAALAALKPGAPPQELQGWRLVPVPARADAAEATRAAVLKQLSATVAAVSADPEAESETFSFTLSHDLRAPIRVVEGFTRIVKEDYGRQLDRVGNDHLDRVLGAAARMNLMIDALLTLARLSQQPLARQRVNLSQLAAYVADDLRRSAPERSADFDIEPQLSAWGDPTLLRLVLENLLGNAWKYTARCTHAQISLRSTLQDSRPALVVRDNGAGFDMRSADRLFGLFQRLHSASDFPGHGVGLASVRRIVRRHGGEIWAESEPGRGAAFYFTLAP